MSTHAEDRGAAVAGVVVEREPDPDVLAGLDVTDKQKPVGSLRNMAHVLKGDPRWQGRLRWSEFEAVVLLDGQSLRDNDLSRLAIWLDEVYGVRGAADNLHRAVNVVAEEHAFHPVRDWLDGLQWDGKPRLDGLLATYFGAEDTPLHRRFSGGWLIGACARVFEPGCQLDTMLMLIGQQGVGKSRACAALVPDRAWFGDSTFDIGNKDAFINLHGKWIYELAECESLKKASDDARKAFITSRTDRRRPFGRLAEDHPRQVVFVATSNNTEVLTDPTGARRFWTVLVGEPDVDGLDRDRDQLFAEALTRYRAGEPWHLDAEHAALLVEAQRQFEVPEAWESALAPWVDLQDRPFTVEDALRDGLGLPFDRWDARRRQRVGKALARLGCTKTRPRAEGSRRVWCWERPDRPDQASNAGSED